MALDGSPTRRVTASPALSENRLIRRLRELVAEFDLDCQDFVIFGSGPLLAHGIRQSVSDLDVVARGSSWQRVLQYGVPSIGSLNGAPMVLFWGGLIQFSSGWISEDWDIGSLISQAEIIDGLPFAQLADVLRYKNSLSRPKDAADVDELARLLTKRTMHYVNTD